MAITKVTREEIEQMRDATQRRMMAAKSKPSPLAKKNFIEMISDSDIATIFDKFNYISHQRLKDYVYVNCFDCEMFFNDFNLLSSKKHGEDVFAQLKNGITKKTPFDYTEFEKYCATMGTTAEQAIYEYFYENVLKKLPYYTKKKNEFDQKVADNVELGTQNSIYASLIRPAIERQRETADLRMTKMEFGSTKPERIADLFSKIKN